MLRFCFNEDVSIEDLCVVLGLADLVFGPNTDVTQYNPSLDDFFDFHKKFPFCICVIKKEDVVVGFATAVLCSNILKDSFLSGVVSGPELVNRAHLNFNNSQFDSLYLMDAYIDKEFRRQGLIKDAFFKIISFYKIKNESLHLFAWPHSSAGLALCKSLSAGFNLNFSYLESNINL
ncbi:MAG: hypothetical protein ACLFN8_03280 [Candidatus Woesearchaeota archaeon]